MLYKFNAITFVGLGLLILRLSELTDFSYLNIALILLLGFIKSLVSRLIKEATNTTVTDQLIQDVEIEIRNYKIAKARRELVKKHKLNRSKEYKDKSEDEAESEAVEEH